MSTVNSRSLRLWVASSSPESTLAIVHYTFHLSGEEVADGDVGSFLHSSGLIYILTTYCSRPGILLWTAVGKVIDFSVMERLVVNAIVWSIPHDYLTFFLPIFFS